jgi:hypothetical protein
MDLSLRNKLERYIGHKTYLSKGKTKRFNEFYHIDCKFSKRKYCECKVFKPTNTDKCLTDLIDIISSDDFKIDMKSKTVEYQPNKSNQYNEKHKLIINEIVSNIDKTSKDALIKEFEGNTLSNKEFKEVFTAIQNDKKQCENCKIKLTDNNYHKGWKNPNTGEAVLLCSICNKKYASGVLDNLPIAPYVSSYNSVSSLKDDGNNYNISNFKPLNVIKPNNTMMNDQSHRLSFKVIQQPNLNNQPN